MPSLTSVRLWQQLVLFAIYSLAVKFAENKVLGTWEFDHFFFIDGNLAYIIGWSLVDGLYSTRHRVHAAYRRAFYLRSGRTGIEMDLGKLEQGVRNMPFVFLDHSLAEFNDGEQNQPSPLIEGEFRHDPNESIPGDSALQHYRHPSSLPYYSFYFDPAFSISHPFWLE